MKKRRLKLKFKILLFILIILMTVTSVFLISKNLLTEKTLPIIEKITTTRSVEKVSSAKLTLVGDLLFEQPFYDAIDNGYDEDLYFSYVKEYFKNDDLSIANMEVVIGNEKLQSSGTGYNFCAPESIGDLVSTLDLEVLSTANNHSNDRGIDGINSTIDYFKNNTDIMTVGTYKSKEDRNKKYIKEINGIKFGFISYTLGTNIKVDKQYRDLIGLYRDPDTKEFNDMYKNIIKNDINNIKDDVDVIIALMHWGKEFTNDYNNEQKDVATFLNEQGVDIIVGSHSHSIQPIEWIGDENKTLVFYSLGNFVSADNDISRTGEKFDNAYQFGLLANLIVSKDKNGISINDIHTEPIINYYDVNMNKFRLLPLKDYTSEFETTHYRYKMNFNNSFITNMYDKVIDKKFN